MLWSNRAILIVLVALALIGFCALGTVGACLLGKTRACVIDFSIMGGDIQCSQLPPRASRY